MLFVFIVNVYIYIYIRIKDVLWWKWTIASAGRGHSNGVGSKTAIEITDRTTGKHCEFRAKRESTEGLRAEKSVPQSEFLRRQKTKQKPDGITISREMKGNTQLPPVPPHYRSGWKALQWAAMLPSWSEPSDTARALGLLQWAVTEPPQLPGPGLQEVPIRSISVPENPPASPARPFRALHKTVLQTTDFSSAPEIENKITAFTARGFAASQTIQRGEEKKRERENYLPAITNTDLRAFAVAKTLLLTRARSVSSPHSPAPSHPAGWAVCRAALLGCAGRRAAHTALPGLFRLLRHPMKHHLSKRPIF